MAAQRICSIPDCGKQCKARGLCNAHHRRFCRYGDPLKGRPPLNLDHGPLCSIEGCGRPYWARGYCSRHWGRWQSHGNPLAGGKSPGVARKHLETAVLTYDGDECLIWPFRRDEHGYGEISIDRRSHKVSRYVCTKVHGEPPTPKHQAAHSCGKGHEGCVTKSHLSWKTRAENEADKVIHGTSNRGARHGMSRLTEEEVREIRAIGGLTPNKEIAKRFGVTTEYVRRLLIGRGWKHLLKAD